MQKRKRGQAGEKGLAPGQKLDRGKLAHESNDRWGWVRHEVTDASQITSVHCLTVAGLGGLLNRTVCVTPYDSTPMEKVAAGETYITVADTDAPLCEKKRCNHNPYCLTFLGQEKWQNELAAKEEFRKVRLRVADPRKDLRDPSLPVGLKNLGATCYCNAFVQVWYQELEFRSGVYKCELSDSVQDPLDSPIFALQLTFAALQEGNLSVFNPVKLVESLRLRTSEQQDAQEFSKLFMTHLDTEFKKQKDPKLQTLISDQFEGKLMYTTVCENCNLHSRRESKFLELEISLAKGEDLRDRLKAMCALERLTDDNKYFCGRCNSLQNATRRTQIYELPPVLHISILRFIYDVDSGERKKSKLPLKFDPYLRLAQLLPVSKGSDADKGMDVDDEIEILQEQSYELRGVLLHKGPSAYHGHYMAEVYDVTEKKWYSFNDERVTPLKSLHKPASVTVTINTEDSDGNEETSKAPKGTKQTKPTKRRRVVDSDVEEVPPAKPNDAASTARPLISSDAYMLIYARRESSRDTDHWTPIHAPIKPPQRALDIIRAENETTIRACEEYEQKSGKVDEKFLKTRAMVLDIYKNWTIDYIRHDDPHIIVSKTGIETWLSHWFNEDSLADVQDDAASITNTSVSVSSSKGSRNGRKDGRNGRISESLKVTSGKKPATLLGAIDNSDIACPHGKLNPLEPQNFKVLNRKAYKKIRDRGYEFKPEFVSADVCKKCVVEEFPERFYQVDHPISAAEFNKVCNCETENSGYWISKAWVKDWLLVKPKMHTPYCNDPSPDSGEYASHVMCEHNHLALNTSLRRRISYEAEHILKAKFPNWYPPAWSTEVCPICEAQLHTRKENRLELRKAAEIEKLQLRRLQEGNVFGRQALLELKDGGVIIKASFIRTWRSWLLKPGDVDRPTSAGNDAFFCEHGFLLLDLSNPVDFDDELAFITQLEYDIIEQLYKAGPIIRISLFTEISDTEQTREGMRTELKCCTECRSNRMFNFDSTTITVVCLRASEKQPSSKEDFLLKNQNAVDNCAFVTNGKEGKANGRQTSLKSYAGIRQSARIKDSKKRRQLRVEVKKETTVLDIKLRILELSDIPTVAQRLFLNGVELAELTRTVAGLGIQHKDYIFMQELMERDDTIELFSDDENNKTKPGRKRQEGNAFGGTLLGGTSRNHSARNSRANTSEEEVDELQPEETVSRICSHCTFENGPDNFCCEICLIPL